ncbi:MAG: ABC transporter ATP-binding protein [Phycisphaerales bacterium JB060]
MPAFWRLAKLMLDFKGRIVLALVCAVLSGSSLAVGLLTSSPIIDGLFEEQQGLRQIAQEHNAKAAEEGGWAVPAWLVDQLPQEAWASLVFLVILIAVLAVAAGVFQFTHSFLALTVVHRTVMRVRRKAFRALLFMPLLAAQRGVGEPGEGSQPGPVDGSDAVSRLITDADQLAYGFEALLSKAVTQVTKGLGALVFAFIIDWKLSLLALVIAPAVWGVIRYFGRRIKRASKAAMGHRAELLSIATESAQALRVVKAYTAERREAHRFSLANRRVYHQMLKARTARALSKPFVEVLTVFILVVLVLVAFWAITQGKLEVPDFIKVLAGLALGGAALKPLTGLLNDMQTSAGAAERLEELLHAAIEPGHEAGLERLPRHDRTIELKDVAVRYPGARSPAVNGVSLTINHGERVAIVGPNGSGKTTLLGLLYRMYDPESGSVLVDGHDLKRVSVRSLRKQVGVVSQETVLFEGSVRDNVAYGKPTASEDEVRTALDRARATEFVEQMPGGIRASIAERGTSLSGGQRQRLAIARAILRDPAILILDEATSMIDAGSEARINEAMDEFSQGRTTVVVAHRLSTVRRADRIVVLQAGKVVDVGTHEALMARCELYQDLARTQLLGGDESDDTQSDGPSG